MVRCTYLTLVPIRHHNIPTFGKQEFGKIELTAKDSKLSYRRDTITSVVPPT